MINTPNKIVPIASIPQEIREWIFSELCAYQVGKILEHLKPPPGKENILALLIGRVVIKDLEAKNFVTTLSKELNLALPTAQLIGTEVKNTVLKPIAASLWKNLQIDVADLAKIPAPPAPPAARVIKMEPPANRPVADQRITNTAESTNKPKETAAPPKARTMEFKQIADVKKPLPPPIGKNIKPKEESEPAPDVIPTPKPFGLSEVSPEAPAAPKGDSRSDSETRREPRPETGREHHEVAKYQDEHPVPPFPGQQ